MPAKSRAILLIGLVAALAGLFIFFSKGDPTEEHGLSQKEHDFNSGHPTTAAEPTDEALPSKSIAHPPTPKISKARTLALLETPIPGPVEFPEQTVLERIEAINVWLEESGIPSEELHIILEPRSSEHLLVTGMICADFRASDFPPSVILLDMFGRSKLRHRVFAGVVEFHFLGAQEPSDLEPFERPDTNSPATE